MPAVKAEAAETRELQEGQGEGQPCVDVRSGGGVSLSSRGCSGGGAQEPIDGWSPTATGRRAQ